MSLWAVGIAACRCSDDPEAALVAYALGSCIGVGAHDPGSGVGGMLHFLLPDSRQDPARAQARPATYADTGIRLLIGTMEAMGAERGRIRARLAGGARILTDGLAVGKRNYLAARKGLWREGVAVEMEAVGGTVSRNLGLRVRTGEFWVQSHETSGEADGWPGQEWER